MPVVTATEEFADLAKALYGDVDVEALWGEVSKMSPDPSAVHVLGSTGRKRRVAKRGAQTEDGRAKLQRRVAVGSNLLGLTAGAAAIGSTLKDDRLERGGKVARRVHAIGSKIPTPIGDYSDKLRRTGRYRTAGKLALGAAGLQAANVVGDVVVSQTLPKEKTSKALEDVEKISIRALTNGRLTTLRRQSAVALNPTSRDPIIAAGARGAKARRGARAAEPVGVKAERSQRVAMAKPSRNLPARIEAPATPMPQSTPQPATRTPLADRFSQRMAAGGVGKPPITAAPPRPQPNAPGVTTPAAAPPASPAQGGVAGFLQTDQGKRVAGAAAIGGGGFALGNRRGKSNAPMDPYAYAKADSVDDVAFEGTFSKFDDDKRLAFGWASVVALNGEPVVDRQGDYIAIGDIEEAAYVYVEKSRVGGDMHRRAAGNLGSELGKSEDQPHKVGELVESMVFTPEKIAKMGLPDDFPVGWWVGYKIHDDDAWAEVKRGNRTGFSIHGKGLRKEVDYDSILEAA